MDPLEYFKDLSGEFHATKNRVQRLIEGQHWPSVGAWKESILRSVLRRYLPNSLSIGGGFIKGKTYVSNQIDILIYDDSGPVFFRDGEFVILPPNIVRAAIQVKTSVKTSQQAEKAVGQLISAGKLLSTEGPNQKFLGLFVFDNTTLDLKKILEVLYKKNGKAGVTPLAGNVLPIDALVFGDSKFIRFWPKHPDNHNRYDKWRAYQFREPIAQGYFVHNIIEDIFPHTVRFAGVNWYPGSGKERSYVAEMDMNGKIESLSGTDGG